MTDLRNRFLGWFVIAGTIFGFWALISSYRFHASLVCAEPSTLIFRDADIDRITYSFIFGVALLVPATIIGFITWWPEMVAQAGQLKTRMGGSRVALIALYALVFFLLTTLMMWGMMEMAKC